MVFTVHGIVPPSCCTNPIHCKNNETNITYTSTAAYSVLHVHVLQHIQYTCTFVHVHVRVALKQTCTCTYIDTETKGSTRFENPRAICSDPSASRALHSLRVFACTCRSRRMRYLTCLVYSTRVLKKRLPWRSVSKMFYSISQRQFIVS